MATDIRALDPNDPGYDEAVEAALREEDEADGLIEPAGAADAGPGGAEEVAGDGAQEAGVGDAAGEQPAAGAEAAAEQGAEQAAGEAGAAGEGEAAAAPSAAKPAAGVLGKDGKTILPYTVLKGAREEARAARQAKQAAEAEAAQLREKLAALQKAGGTTEDMRERAEAGLLTEEERADFPALAKIEAAIKKIEQRPEPKAEPQKGAQDAEQEDPEAMVQEAIDSVPALASWQASDREKFARAVRHDEVLRESPRWKDRPLAERFAHVAKIVADEYEVPLEEEPAPTPKAASPQAPAKPRQDPKQAAAAAKRTTPSTLSDFKGGAPESPGTPIERSSAPAQVARFMGMSDDDIDRHLARLG